MSEERYRLTEDACMQPALNDFDIEASTKMAKAIKEVFIEVFMDYIEKAGHIGKVDEDEAN